jgi:hypothetical protein
VDGHFEPRGQGWQVPPPKSEYVPEEQAIGSLVVEGHSYPAGHYKH